MKFKLKEVKGMKEYLITSIIFASLTILFLPFLTFVSYRYFNGYKNSSYLWAMLVLGVLNLMFFLYFLIPLIIKLVKYKKYFGKQGRIVSCKVLGMVNRELCGIVIVEGLSHRVNVRCERFNFGNIKYMPKDGEMAACFIKEEDIKKPTEVILYTDK